MIALKKDTELYSKSHLTVYKSERIAYIVYNVRIAHNSNFKGFLKNLRPVFCK